MENGSLATDEHGISYTINPCMKSASSVAKTSSPCKSRSPVLSSASPGDFDENCLPQQILAEPRLIPAEYISAAEIGSPRSH